MGGWMGGLVIGWFGGWVGSWVGSGQITKNQINLDLIDIIQFCLKIYNLWRNPKPMGRCMGDWVVGWVDGWGHVNSIKIE